MRAGSTRSGLMVAFAVVGGVLLLASAAFACVPFRGKGTLVGTNGGITVTGSGKGMGWCEEPGRGPKVEQGETISLSVRPELDTRRGDCPGKLSGGVPYGIAYGHLDEGEENLFGANARASACFPFNNKNAVPIGTMDVASDGTGSGSATLPPTAKPGEASICLYHPSEFVDGLAWPILVL